MPAIMIIIAAVLVGLDQLFKYLTVTNLAVGEMLPVIPGLLELTHLRNSGAAFGMLDGWRVFFIVSTSLVCAFFVMLLFRYKKHTWLSYAACTLILAGGLGNLIDRAFNGYVVDYIKVSFFDPIFNFADCCVTVGTVLVLCYVLFVMDRTKEKKGHAPIEHHEHHAE